MSTNRKSASTSRWKVRIWFALLLLIGLLAYPTASVMACSCLEAGLPAAEYPQARAVFEGKVVQIHENASGYRIDFSVIRSWKGISTSTTEVTAGYGDGDCGYSFNIDEAYVVYAYGAPNDLQTDICSRTAPVSRAVDDLRYLDTLPPIFVASTPQSSSPQQIDTISLILIGCLLLIAMLWLLRRQRRTPL